jgi:hypothetical protein
MTVIGGQAAVGWGTLIGRPPLTRPRFLFQPSSRKRYLPIARIYRKIEGQMSRLNTFPHLTSEEFGEAITGLYNRFEKNKQEQLEWASVDVLRGYDTTYLQITKILDIDTSGSPSLKHDVEEEEAMEDEDDAVCFPRPPPLPTFDNMLGNSTHRTNPAATYYIRHPPLPHLPRPGPLHLHSRHPAPLSPYTINTLHAHRSTTIRRRDERCRRVGGCDDHRTSLPPVPISLSLFHARLS